MNGRSAISSAILIPGAILVLVIGVFALLSGLGSLGFRGLTERRSNRSPGRRPSGCALAVDVLDIPRELADLNAREVRSGRRPPTPHPSKRRFLRDRSDGVSRARAVIFSAPSDDMMWVERVGDDDAIKVAIHRREDAGTCTEYLVSSNGRLEEPPLKTFPYVPSTRPYHVTAMNAGPAGDWTPLYLWASADAVPATGVGFVRRVRSDDGTPLGIVGVECTVRGLSETLGRIKVTPNARMMVLDELGQLVVADDPRLSPSRAVSVAGTLDDPLIARMATEATRLRTRVEDPTEIGPIRRSPASKDRRVDGGARGRAARADWVPPWRLVVAILEETFSPASGDSSGGWRSPGSSCCSSPPSPASSSPDASCADPRAPPDLRPDRRGDLEARFEPSGGRESGAFPGSAADDRGDPTEAEMQVPRGRDAGPAVPVADLATGGRTRHRRGERLLRRDRRRLLRLPDRAGRGGRGTGRLGARRDRRRHRPRHQRRPDHDRPGRDRTRFQTSTTSARCSTT